MALAVYAFGSISEAQGQCVVPTITAVTPNTGPAAGGTSVTLTGTGFNFLCVSSVQFGANSAPLNSFNSLTELVVTSPAGTGAVNVTATTSAGTSATSAANVFTYVTPAPAVTSISPASGPTTGGTSVTITGTNFTGATAVRFGSTNATGFTVNSATRITATSPPGSGTADVTVTTSAGTSSTSPAGQFSYATPADSTNARSLQTSITKSVATTPATVIAGALDGGIADGFSGGGTTPSIGPNGGFIGFAAIEPRSEVQKRPDEAFAALAYAGNPTNAPFTKAPPRTQREWSLWADIRGTGWKANDTTGAGNDLRGNQFNLTAGLGRKLAPNTLVGVVVGYEVFKYDVAALAGSLKGHGQSVGGYFAQRFGTNLLYDAALVWSNMSYNATSGTAAGSFTGSRWLFSSGLTGTHRHGGFVLQPSAKLFVLWEAQKAWTDTLGTLQDARKFSAGRTALGAQVARPWTMSNRWIVAPYVGAYGDWRFSSDNALPTGSPVANIGNGWSGRVTSGLSATAPRGVNVSLGGELGGLGATYKIWSGNVRAVVPF